MEFKGKTEGDLVLYVLELQQTLDECNLKQEKESEWFDDLKARLERTSDGRGTELSLGTSYNVDYVQTEANRRGT